MWLVYLLLGVAAVIVWLLWAGAVLCPRCGIELAREFGAPWRRRDHCRCGWRRDELP